MKKEIKAQKALQTATKEAWIEYDATMANAGKHLAGTIEQANIDEELELGTYQAIIKEAWEVHNAEEKLALEALDTATKAAKKAFKTDFQLDGELNL